MIVERVIAFRYAKSIGFSPPRHACQRSGFASRIKKKTMNALRKMTSAIAIVLKWALAKKTISSLIDQKTISEIAANKIVEIPTLSALNPKIPELAINHVIVATIRSPNGLLKR